MYKKRNFHFRVLIITIYIYFIAYLITTPSMEIIIDMSFISNRILADWLFIVYIIVLVEIVICIYYTLQYYRNRDNKDYEFKDKILIYFKRLFIILSFALFIFLTVFESNTVSTGGIFRIQNKIIEDNKYYFVVNDKKVLCNRSEYSLISIDSVYAITYYWNELFPDKAKLVLIEPGGVDDYVK